jgi:NAD(P)-dependent dehydrogenase (short-subunit alcohol dehydrogenase family)
VVLADVHEDAARSAAEELVAADHKAIAVPCNVADEAEVATMVERTVSTFGRLDAAYNDGRHERHFERPANWATGVAGGDRRCRACRGGERLPDSTEDPQ